MRKSDLILRLIYEILKELTGKKLLKHCSMVVSDYENDVFKILQGVDTK